MRKTKHKTFSLRSRTTSLLLALLLILSAASVGLAAIASAIAVDDDSGGLARTGAGGKVSVASGSEFKADSDKAFWVDAQYFDYLSDEEYAAGWLNPKEAGTGYDNADDDWYTFETFNEKISSYAGNQSMKYPLYFGNFCNTVSKKNDGGGDYIYGSHEFTIRNAGDERETVILKDHGGPYARVVNGLYNYNYFIENSNGLNDRHDSVIGLAGNKLNSSGNITTPTAAGSVEMPYFSEGWLGNAAKVVDSFFPFRVTPGNNVTTYSFDSTGATDNVFFNWNGANPTSVAYGQNTTFGVRDGLKKFMGDDVEAGYGIFPFNRAENGNGGNNKLDYGFGIRMNMDFRVPKNGTIDGKTNGTPVQFNYSGDDDIWIYITPYKSDGTLDYNNSYLALDLGGNHKMAAGNINFKTMKSTVTTEAAYANSNVTYKGDRMYVALSEGWNNVEIWAWDSNSEGIWVPKTKASFQESGRDVYEFKLSDFGGRTKFTTVEYQNNWDGKRAKNEGKNLNCVIHNQLGNVCWSDNPNWIEPKYPDGDRYHDLAGVQYATTAQKTKTLNGGQQLDSDKTYHMTIFYMERGLIESNCQMSFTMTPVRNDFKVKKTVDVSDINADTSDNGLRAAICQLPFSFTTKENGSVCKSTKYVLNDQTYDVNSSTGVYTLKHDQLADFNNQHETGSTMQVIETTPAGLSYDTSWKIVDNNNNGNTIKQSTAGTSSTGTGDFTLVDPRNSSAPANLQVNFTNKPKASPSFTLSKRVFAKAEDIYDGDDGDDIACDQEFEFLLKINLKGQAYSTATANDFKAYNLAYSIQRGQNTIDGTATNGRFKIKAGDTISIPGIPVGATYRLQEIECENYLSTAYSHDNGADTALGADAAVNGIVESDGDFFMFSNVENITYNVVNGSFEVEKLLKSGNTTTPYQNGRLFSFRAKGLGSVTYASGKTSVDATDQTENGGKNYVEVVSVNANGRALFQNSGEEDPFLKFENPGVYIFEVWESGINSNDAKLKDTFKSNSQRFLVKFTVTAQGTGLLCSDPEYFIYDGSAVGASSFSNDKKLASGVPQIVNEIKTGKIKINKKDGAGAGLGGIQFKLYRKGESEPIATLTTNNSGYAEKDGIDIYKAVNGAITGTPAYQEYVLKETSTKPGHMLENTVYEFGFPLYDADAGAYKYEFTFDYVNAALKVPDAGGSGPLNNKPLGIALIFLAFVSAGLMIARLKKKQLAADQEKRFH